MNRRVLAVLGVGLCVACDGEDPALRQTRLDWSVDTIAVIGVADGDASQEFVQLIAADLNPTGDLVLLDLRRPGVYWFDREGRFKAATSRGRGPGEVAQPRAIAIDQGGSVLVLDPGNAGLLRLREVNGRPVLDSFIHTTYVTTSFCTLGERIYAAFLRDGMVTHLLGPDGDVVQSFGPAPEVPGLEALGNFAVEARRQIVESRLFCDQPRGRIVLAGRSHPLVRAYDLTGQLTWSVELDGIYSVRFEMTGGGAVEGVLDPVHGTHFTRSMLRWDDRHLLVQYVRRFPGEPPEGRDFHGIDSRLLDLDTGTEVARSESLPLLAAARGDRFVVLENLPYPRAIVVRRN